jgi:hypothetical protein
VDSESGSNAGSLSEFNRLSVCPERRFPFAYNEAGAINAVASAYPVPRRGDRHRKALRRIEEWRPGTAFAEERKGETASDQGQMLLMQRPLRIGSGLKSEPLATKAEGIVPSPPRISTMKGVPVAPRRLWVADDLLPSAFNSPFSGRSNRHEK